MSERWLWTQKEDIGPRPRVNAAMAYEAARQRVVLFGGRDSSGYFNDTWEWDGTEWTQIADTGPSVRALLPMVFDSSRECLVLFGGSGPLAWLGDTWEWSEDAGWVERQDMGPRSIAWPTMARTQEHTVLHGFQSGGTGAVQTWEWDGSLWTQRQDMGPPRRVGAALAYDSQRDRVVLFGGTTYVPPYGYLGDTWELEITEQ
jgi:Kelch motif